MTRDSLHRARYPDNEALEMSIVENIQRKDLNVFEQAHSIMSLAEIYGYTHEEIAKKIGKSRVTVSELIRITDLPDEIMQKCLRDGDRFQDIPAGADQTGRYWKK